MLALHPRTVDALWAAIEPLLPESPSIRTRWAVTGPAETIASASKRSCTASSRAAPGMSPDGSARGQRPRCVAGSTNGPTRVCSTNSPMKRSRGMTASSAWTSRRSRSTGPSTRHPSGEKAPARTPPTGPRTAGSGRSRRTGGGSRSAGNRPERTATTASCWNRPSTPLRAVGSSSRSRRCTSTGATTTVSPEPCASSSASMTSCARSGVRGDQPRRSCLSHSGCSWSVERTNSWLSNFGQLRRNTDRFIHQRLAQFALAVAAIPTVKLIKWADRWNPDT